ncbi:MAG: SelB C-terminal domain-containing protein, partial [Fretibacterium sp.]
VFPSSPNPGGAAARAAAVARIEALGSAAAADDRLRCLVEEAGMMEAPRAAVLVQEAPSDLAAVVARLVKTGALVELKGERPLLLSSSRFASLEAKAVSELKDYQKAFPSEAGMPLDELMRRLALPDARVLRSFAALLAERGRIVTGDNKARTPDFVVRNEGEFRRNSEALASFCRKRGWQLATLEEVRSELRMEPNAFTQLIQSLKNTRELVILEGGYVLTSEMENAMLDILRGIGGNVTLAAVRDATNSSRKFILPVLEYFDSKGYTRRVGDVRVVKGAAK